MKKWAACVAGIVMVSSGVAMAQEADPCEGNLDQGEIGLNYEGHCVGVVEDGDPVQPVIVRLTEGLGGVEACWGILVVRTADGWEIADTVFYENRAPVDCEIGQEDFDITGGQ